MQDKGKFVATKFFIPKELGSFGGVATDVAAATRQALLDNKDFGVNAVIIRSVEGGNEISFYAEKDQEEFKKRLGLAGLEVSQDGKVSDAQAKIEDPEIARRRAYFAELDADFESVLAQEKAARTPMAPKAPTQSEIASAEAIRKEQDERRNAYAASLDAVGFPTLQQMEAQSKEIPNPVEWYNMLGLKPNCSVEDIYAAVVDKQGLLKMDNKTAEEDRLLDIEKELVKYHDVYKKVYQSAVLAATQHTDPQMLNAVKPRNFQNDTEREAAIMKTFAEYCNNPETLRDFAESLEAERVRKATIPEPKPVATQTPAAPEPRALPQPQMRAQQPVVARVEFKLNIGDFEEKININGLINRSLSAQGINAIDLVMQRGLISYSVPEDQQQIADKVNSDLFASFGYEIKDGKVQKTEERRELEVRFGEDAMEYLKDKANGNGYLSAKASIEEEQGKVSAKDDLDAMAKAVDTVVQRVRNEARNAARAMNAPAPVLAPQPQQRPPAPVLAPQPQQQPPAPKAFMGATRAVIGNLDIRAGGVIISGGGAVIEGVSVDSKNNVRSIDGKREFVALEFEDSAKANDAMNRMNSRIPQDSYALMGDKLYIDPINVEKVKSFFQSQNIQFNAPEQQPQTPQKAPQQVVRPNPAPAAQQPQVTQEQATKKPNIWDRFVNAIKSFGKFLAKPFNKKAEDPEVERRMNYFQEVGVMTKEAASAAIQKEQDARKAAAEQNKPQPPTEAELQAKAARDQAAQQVREEHTAGINNAGFPSVSVFEPESATRAEPPQQQSHRKSFIDKENDRQKHPTPPGVGGRMG